MIQHDKNCFSTRLLTVLVSQAKDFPFVLFAAAAATTHGLYLSWSSHPPAGAFNLLAGLVFAIGFTLACALIERFNPIRFRLLSLTGVIVSLSLFWVNRDLTGEHAVLRWAHLFVASHLLVSIAPFLLFDQPPLFWEHNRRMLRAFVVASACSAAICIGLFVALGVSIYLFDIQRGSIESIFFSVFVVSSLFIHPLIFLWKAFADAPPLQPQRYPRGLAAFVTWVLIPLVLLYLGIVYAYSVKIAVQQQLPKGMVGWLICSLGAMGVLTWLLVWPAPRGEMRLASAFRRLFFPAFIPLLILLAVAISERVGAYGFTEKRYYLLLLTAWISIATLYWSFRPQTSPRYIPASLFLLAAITVFGPLSPYDLAFKSQSRRLSSLLFTPRGCFPHQDASLDFETRRKISSSLTYLFERHFDTALPFLEANCRNNPEIRLLLNEFSSERSTIFPVAYNLTERFLDKFSIRAVRSGEGNLERLHFYHSIDWARRSDPIDCRDYSLVLPNLDIVSGSGQQQDKGNLPPRVRAELVGLEFRVILENGLVLSKDLGPWLKSFPPAAQGATSHNLPSSQMEFSYESGDFGFKFIAMNIGGVTKPDGYELFSLTGTLLVRVP